jgi:hypothetical protein
MNIRSSRRAITEIGHRETRQDKVDETSRVAHAEHVDCLENLSVLETQQSALVSVDGPEYIHLRYTLWVLAVIVVLTDIPLQFLLNHLSFQAVSVALLWVLAPFISGAFAAGTHGVAHVSTFDPLRPRRSVRICLTLAGVVGAIAITALTVLLYARMATADAAPYLASLVSTSLWVLGESLPVIGGLLSAAAHTLSYQSILRGRIRHLQARLAEIDRFNDWLQNEKAKIAQPQPVSVSRVATTIVVIILGATLLMGTSTDAQTAVQRPIGRHGSCAVFVDVTKSINKDVRQSATMRFLESLDDFTNTYGCENLRVGVFSDAGPFTPSVQLEVPKSPPIRDCDDAPIQVSGTAVALSSMEGFRRYYAQEAKRKCLAAVAADNQNYILAHKTFSEQIHSILLQDVKPQPECTAIVGLLSRLLQAHTETIVLLTDAAETCSRRIPVMSVVQGERVIFILVPSDGDIRFAGIDALERGGEWKNHIPNLAIVLPSEISRTEWAYLAGEKNIP